MPVRLHDLRQPQHGRLVHVGRCLVRAARHSQQLVQTAVLATNLAGKSTRQQSTSGITVPARRLHELLPDDLRREENALGFRS
eukprot:CAMPEP_0183568362 /NCGR_PEP_ID=MMETSP0371-20130417/117021_1 /TAXON_ID=268820 /ORGANISM="Peridinium aciculiferum, Strain PAER-2" /LENGTH=82 /DNA_ID=CAMNT_0025777857 /DNA_START=604 /DNA_END=849 /DNA_ORIENTATION=-